MVKRTLIERLNVPWPKHEVEEVTLPAWVIELCAEGVARITALETQLAEAMKALDTANELDVAGHAILCELNARIDAAPSSAKPVFNRIADLHDALGRFRDARAALTAAQEAGKP